MGTLRFSIPGQPRPKGRPRFVKGRVITPGKTVKYEKHVKACAQAAVLRNRWEQLAGPVALKIVVVTQNKRRGDLDNHVKAVKDAMNGVVYGDDRQVVYLEAAFDEDPDRPRVEVWARPMEDS
jgi:Holliday junction resolvase RusA-like endonuclease